MLHQIGATDCPRCTTKLVHEFDVADWVLPVEQSGMDQRWICPGCGYSRPVTYMVDRPVVAPSSMADSRATRQRIIQ